MPLFQMVRRTPLLLLAGLLLASIPGRAQQGPVSGPAAAKPVLAPSPQHEPQMLTVKLPLPSLVARLGEAAGLLERSVAKKTQAQAGDPVPDAPVLVFRVPLPRLFSPKPASTPVTP